MAVLDRVPAGRVGTRTWDVRPGRAVLTVIAAVLFGLGWVAAKTSRAVWPALAWTGTALAIGWDEARGRPGGG